MTNKTNSASSDAEPAISSRSAEFAFGTRWDDLPKVVQSESVRTFVNWVACAVGGARTASADAAINGLLRMSGAGTTPVLGRRERLQAADAALANCLTSAADTFDDTHLSTITHPTGPVAAAILSVAQTRQVSGQEFLRALAIGIEIECRISAAITAPGSGASQGWYITGVSGGIGAAAAAALLLGASHAEFITALGLAASQAAGLRATHGSMAVAFVPAFAARNGLAAAQLAMAGFTCGDKVIEGRNGLLPVLAPDADPTVIYRDLGIQFELLGNAYKPYPCGIVIHPSIDGCLDIARRAGSSNAIAQIELDVHADALFLCWRKLPTTELEAQVSLFHWAAAALARGQAGLDEGNAAAIADPEIRRLQSVMNAKVDPALASGQARVRVSLNDGTVLHSNVTQTTGSLERPMTNEELSAKFRLLASHRLSDESVDTLLQSCWLLPESLDAGNIGRLGALS
ncbi:2-methylcitrate dehydratase PrpD [Trinickia symbiotica]|nr:2-methylcitrate dehydratase PrpD [Trinickia symbiotica]